MELDTRTVPVYVAGEGEVMIEAPVEKVWPIVRDYASWQNYSRQEIVFGVPGEVGEVVLLKKEEMGSPGAPYFARTIRLDPGRRIVWKTFREGDDYFGIVDFAVEGVEGRTRFSYDVLYEYVRPAGDPEELEAFREQKQLGLATMGTVIFPKLKALAESTA